MKSVRVNLLKLFIFIVNRVVVNKWSDNSYEKPITQFSFNQKRGRVPVILENTL